MQLIKIMRYVWIYVDIKTSKFMNTFPLCTSFGSQTLQGVQVWKGFPGLMSLLKQQHFLYQGDGSQFWVCSPYYSAPDVDGGKMY